MAVKTVLVANVAPNRMKFASLVGKLEPHHPDFAQRVAELQMEFEHREALINKLVDAVCATDRAKKALGCYSDAQNELDIALRAAIERFVVDRY